MRRPSLTLLAVLLFAIVTGTLARGHRDVGYVRDEGIYFEASRAYAQWAADVAQTPKRLFDRKHRDRAFAINHEHPALMKLAAGLSARLLARPTHGDSPSEGTFPLLLEGAAMRLPAQILAGFGALLLFLFAARRHGILAGLLAAGFVFTLPRVWFHAGLHAFDAPIMVATLVVALAYRKALASPWWSLALGPLLGVAIAIKHNALFLPFFLTLHLAWCLVTRGKGGHWTRFLPAPLWSMALLAPPCALGLWPWLWTDPVSRLRDYFAFHAQHNWYNMEFLGVNYNQPPMPFAYPWVMTWATVPTTLLLLGCVGLLRRQRTPSRGPGEDGITVPPPAGDFWRPLPEPSPQDDTRLWLILALGPLLVIAWPTTPIFGGTKHWLTAYPFLALAAADTWAWMTAPIARIRWLAPALLALILAPSTWSTAHAHPFGISQYAPLLGPRGAADLGLNRGYWGHIALPFLPDLDPRRDAPLCPGDLHPLARAQYVREGRWPHGLELGAHPRCRAALHHYEKHMVTYELTVWRNVETTAPTQIVALDDVPLAALYQRAP